MKIKKIIFLFLCFSNLGTGLSFSADLTKSVVKIFVTANRMNYYQPWQSQGIASSSGSGAIIEGNRILTNAHVVSDQTFIQVKKKDDTKRYTARVLTVAHDCDLALLTVDDKEFFKGTEPLLMGDLPFQQDSVTVIGYPQGGEKLSITEGVVSRIEISAYSHSSRQLLAVQIDAAINPGNSGGPIIKDGKLVGVAMQVFQAAENIGYIIPVPVINHLFADLKDGSYDGFPVMGINFVNTENNSLRKYQKMGNEEGGVVISRVMPYSATEGLLKEGDIVLSIDGIPIGEDGSVTFRDEERVSLSYLITNKQIGDDISFGILRDGKKEKIAIKLKPYNPLVFTPYYFNKPSYYIYGGFIFTVLSTDLLMSWGNDWWNKAPLDLIYYMLGLGRLNQENLKEIVVLLNVLPDEINVGYHNYQNEIIKEVNGTVVTSFDQFVKLVDAQRNQPFTVFKTGQNTDIIIENTDIDAVNESILKRNNIPAQFSDDVASWLRN